VPLGLLREIRIEARRRGMAPADLIVTVLRNVAGDDLFAAVIDR
jgi:hypothetical protein